MDKLLKELIFLSIKSLKSVKSKQIVTSFFWIQDLCITQHEIPLKLIFFVFLGRFKGGVPFNLQLI